MTMWPNPRWATGDCAYGMDSSERFDCTTAH